jgi:predicted ATPase
MKTRRRSAHPAKGSPFLHRIASVPESVDRTAYPFNIPAFSQGIDIALRSKVAFFVGENGSGKSTLLEAIAIAARAITVGGRDLEEDPTLAGVGRLADHLRLSWKQRISRGFFMRSEDFFNFASRTADLASELDELAEAFGRDRRGDWKRAQGIARAERRALLDRYGDLHARSHGESFLTVFRSRLVPDGLYLLDEPETALSPQRQLAFLAMLKDIVTHGAQLIIATHSPIILAFPGATLLRFDGGTIAPVAYDDFENVRLTRDFLANPDAFLRRL